MAFGTVVVAGRTYVITGLRLRDGQLQITAYGQGPSPAITNEPVAVFGEDGQGVCQSWCLSLPKLGSHDNMHIILPLQLTHLDVLDAETKIEWK